MECLRCLLDVLPFLSFFRFDPSFDLGLVLEKYLKIRLLIEIQLIPISLFKNIIINKKKRSQILSSAYINTPSGKVHN